MQGGGGGRAPAGRWKVGVAAWLCVSGIGFGVLLLTLCMLGWVASCLGAGSGFASWRQLLGALGDRPLEELDSTSLYRCS